MKSLFKYLPTESVYAISLFGYKKINESFCFLKRLMHSSEQSIIPESALTIYRVYLTNEVLRT